MSYLDHDPKNLCKADTMGIRKGATTKAEYVAESSVIYSAEEDDRRVIGGGCCARMVPINMLQVRRDCRHKRRSASI